MKSQEQVVADLARTIAGRGIRTLVLAERHEWIPASVPSGMVVQVISDAVAQVRAAATAGLEFALLFQRGQTASGECLVVSDHINLTGSNPLVGPNVEAWGVRFPDMTEPYPLRTLLAPIGSEGVVADMPTPPNWRDLSAAGDLGAESVTSGLSAAVIAANHCGLKVGAVLIPAGVDGGLTLERALRLMAD